MRLSTGIVGSVPQEATPGAGSPSDISWSWGSSIAPANSSWWVMWRMRLRSPEIRAAKYFSHPHPCHNGARGSTRHIAQTHILRSEEKEKAILQTSAQNIPIASRELARNLENCYRKALYINSFPPLPRPPPFQPSMHGHAAASGVGGQDTCQADVP